MLIKALCDYCNILDEKGQILDDKYSFVDISYLISLTPEGVIDGIIDCRDIEIVNGGKKEKKIPKKLVMPKRTEKSGIDANIIEHRPLYLFGLNMDKDILTTKDKTNKAQKSHEKFVEVNYGFLDELDSPVVNAYKNFIKKWKPTDEIENPYLLSLGKEYNKYFAFCLSGEPDKLLHDDPQIKEKWNRICNSSIDNKADTVMAQCAVDGQVAQIAKIHSKIKGLYGGLTTGGVLVGFNNQAEESYGYKQAYNSNISEAAMNRYTKALNYLLASKKNKKTIDDLTVVFWAMSKEEKYDDLFSAMMFYNDDAIDAEQTEEMLRKLMDSAKEGNIAADRLEGFGAIDPNVDFYMVGLKPNSSRIALKFIYRKKIAAVFENIAKHQNDMNIVGQKKTIELWQIKKELVSPKSNNETVDPSLLTKIFEAIIYNKQYPEYLLATAVRRVKTDTDLKINYIRAGIIKACINRKERQVCREEELTVALNKENTNQAYLCGRLFAVLERLQQSASNNQLNRTIKDAYFASAASKPAIIFPKLLKLAQNHLNKAASPVFFNKKIGEIVNALNGEFPDTLNLTEQGKFIIGYYHQMQSFFEKNENKNEEK